MRERLRADWDNDRILQDEGDRKHVENQLTLARNLAPGVSSLFVREGVVPIDDPVAALAWLPNEEETAARKSAKNGAAGLDPAAAIALDDGEIEWLDGFLARKQDQDAPVALESIEQVDGFFCALVAGPEGASADEFIPVIWSKDGRTDDGTRPKYDSDEQAEYVETLLTRHWHTILLRLERGWGQTAPNPMVGAVVVRDGVAVGRGFHAKFGEAHAEVVALADAGERARGAELFVTLEPCNHQGKTPPCVDALIGAGVRRVVA